MQDQTFEIKMHFGTVEIVPELRSVGNEIHGGGYKIVRDQHGNVTEQTAWEPNGIVLTMASYDEPDKPWWKFWG